MISWGLSRCQNWPASPGTRHHLPVHASVRACSQCRLPVTGRRVGVPGGCGAPSKPSAPPARRSLAADRYHRAAGKAPLPGPARLGASCRPPLTSAPWPATSRTAPSRRPGLRHTPGRPRHSGRVPPGCADRSQHCADHLRGDHRSSSTRPSRGAHLMRPVGPGRRDPGRPQKSVGPITSETPTP
jgi:hypothetical protein